MLQEFSAEDRKKYVLSVRNDLKEKVKAIKEDFFKNPSGLKTVQVYTRLIDDTIASIYKTFRDDFFSKSKTAVPSLSFIAIGGYGRGELNMNSDIDILFLYDRKPDSFVDHITGNMLPFLWDIGLEIGHSSRSINDCLSIAKDDIESLTALLESRLLAGSEKVYFKFFSVLKKYLSQRSVNSFIIQNTHGKKNIDEKSIHSIFISEPDIKESPGGLRDIHCALWASRAIFSAGSLEELRIKNIIDIQEHDSLKNSMDLIFKIRNALHIYTGKKNDILAHEVQNKVTEMLGYEASNGRSGVEFFMRDYYAAAYNIHILSNILIHRCLSYRGKTKKILDLFRQKDIGNGFVKYKKEISLKAFNENFFVENPGLLFDLFQYMQQFELELSENLKRLIRKNISLLKNIKWESHDLKGFFIDILKSKNSAKVLRSMHEVDVLGLFLPEFAKCKFQIHNDFFHKYTVDEHCLQSVEKLESLSSSAEDELAEILTVYQTITKQEILKLSLLLHDTGKAEGTDHIETGVIYVENIAKRFNLEDEDAKLLNFLVKNHLLMNRIAQRRDLADKKNIIEFAAKVKNIELLKMLYVHTCVDIMAVSPAMWTEWKGALLWELYHKTFDYLMVDDSIDVADHEIADNCKKEVLSLLTGKDIDIEFVNYSLNNMPEKYFVSLVPKKITKHIFSANQLNRKIVAIDFSRNDKLGFWDLSVCTKGKVGTLSKITGILSARSLNILSAQVYSGRDGLAIDLLRVTQPEDIHIEEAELFAKLEKDMEDVLSNIKDVSDILKSRRVRIEKDSEKSRLIPTTVLVDNNASEKYTVIEIIFQDRIGSLHILTTAFSYLGINIVNAKISTEGKRGFDVFYVSDLDGKKIVDEKKLKTLKAHLEKSLD